MKLTLALCLLACTTLSLFASNSDENGVDSRAATTSSCSLVNPPNSSIEWNFNGNQLIWVTLKNGNVLGVTATLTCEIFVGNKTKSFVLLPFGSTGEMRYDIFGYIPIGWRFILSTISDAALIYGQARWDPF